MAGANFFSWDRTKVRAFVRVAMGCVQHRSCVRARLDLTGGMATVAHCANAFEFEAIA